VKRSKDLQFRIFLFALAILGVLVTRHYGESWDELKFYKYADQALQAYPSWLTTGEIPVFGNTYDNYGPPYVMAVALGAQGLQHLLPWSLSDLRHLLYFFTFLGGIWAFYELAKRWLSHPAAFGSTLLFSTQPLFWGHAFISPKDIPFLTFFLLALLYGLRLFDRLQPLSLNGLAPRSKRTLLVLTVLWLVAGLLLVLGTDLFRTWIESAVRAAAAGRPNLIAYIASDLPRVGPDIYIRRYFTLFIQARAVFLFLFTVILVFLYRKWTPDTFNALLGILPSALLLGVASSIRILGPLAGLLVALYAIRKHGNAALPMLTVYACFALAGMYATWPYLWPDPVGHFIESLSVMSQYPWPGQVLFNGVQYASTDIPRTFLPFLLAIQLTEPVWILFLVGLIYASIDLVRKQEHGELLVLSLLWFALPLGGFILTRTPLYDNFRQVFFILPPVFLLAGIVFEKVKRTLWQSVLILLVCLPAILAGIHLHPYEYIYYNRFVGGEAGAFRRFETDYWGTSYRQAAAWLNEVAPPQAAIWVDGPAHLLDMYLRADLRMFSPYEAERAAYYDYIVLTSRYDLDLSQYPDARIVHTIERDGAILTAIKQP
jgi:hypothetical protein